MAMSERKFKRSIYTIVVLSEDEPPDDLGELAIEVDRGPMLVSYSHRQTVQIDAVEMARLAEREMAGAEFFQLSLDGEDLDE